MVLGHAPAGGHRVWWPGRCREATEVLSDGGARGGEGRGPGGHGPAGARGCPAGASGGRRRRRRWCQLAPPVPAAVAAPEVAGTGAAASARAATTGALAVARPAAAAVAAVMVPAALPVPPVEAEAPVPEDRAGVELDVDGPVLPVLVELEALSASPELPPVALGVAVTVEARRPPAVAAVPTEAPPTALRVAVMPRLMAGPPEPARARGRERQATLRRPRAGGVLVARPVGAEEGIGAE